MKTWHLIAAATLIFLISHLFALTLLPVFADESIYIRWAQLIMDEPARYAFFALNDGKTPLFIWMLVPFQYLFADPLFAGRFVAVLGGLMQLIVSVWLTKLMGGKRTAQVATAVLITCLPFWFLHHRVALMDGWLTAMLTLTFGGVIWISQHRQPSNGNWVADVWQSIQSFFKPQKDDTAVTKAVALTALSFGAALWLKLPAVLLIPAVCVPVATRFFTHRKNTLILAVRTFFVVTGGVAVFALLAANPAFGQLFSRGSDFLFPWQEVILHGAWRSTIVNLPTYGMYFTQYLSWAVLLILVGLFLPGKKRQHLELLLGALVFFLPIALLGKTVYPRYFLPVGLFLTTSMALSFEQLLYLMKPRTYWSGKTVLKGSQRLAAVTVVLACCAVLYTSLPSIFASYTDVAQVPFVAADRGQYLTEWSSGHGVIDTVALIQERSAHTNLAVATEGFFGTLPDAVLMYLHGEKHEQLVVEGVGQPVGGLSYAFLARAATADEVWLVVNSHRLLKQFPESRLIAQYCRPFAAPCLQVWDVTEYAQSPAAYDDATGTDNR